MNELQRALVGDSAAAPPQQILQGLTPQLASRTVAGAPRSIYEELWHIAFWQQVSLEWCNRIETPYPAHAADGFPGQAQIAGESWEELCNRFLVENGRAAEMARDGAHLEHRVRCPSQPGNPVREMTVREQLESLAAHNAYHFGRIVLLRQLHGAWPPPSGGFSW